MKNVINESEQLLERVALYLRLSKEDLDKLNSEERSESIKNQERMLREKVAQEPWQIVDIYIDEDYSGADSNRPEFNRMINDCKNGKIDIVLCKSQSRFSRNMELIEKYIHNKFIEWNIRFIGLVDNADTDNEENKKSRQINGLVNEWYLEDTSKNIKETLRNKKKAGLYTGSFAPYGYKKDENNKNYLVVDPVASEVVKKIFELYNSGWGYYKIVNYLNCKKIPCPYDYKIMHGYKIGSPTKRKHQNIISINKKGRYIIFNTFVNEELEKVTNIISIGMLTCNNLLGEKIDDNIDLFVRKLDKGMRIFSSSTLNEQIDLSTLQLYNNHIWKELKVGDVISKDTLYIAVIIDEIRSLNNKTYELEVTVNSNSKNSEYYFMTNIVHDGNKKVKYCSKYEKKSSWSDRTISEILRNEVYIGNLVQGKFKNISYKNQKSRHIPKKDWIIVKNTHTSIIDKDTWDSVQARLNLNNRCDTITGKINPLSKKVYCNICGKSFEKTCGSKHKYEYLVCRDRRMRWINCDNKTSIRIDQLENEILLQINNFIQNFKDEKILNNLKKEMINEELFQDKIDALRKELQDNENEIIIQEKCFKQLYEDRVHQIINDNQFSFLNQRYNEDIKNIQDRQRIIKTELELIYREQAKFKNKDESFKNYEKVDKLTVELMNEWIDKIYIDKVNEEQNSRNIKIIWNF